MTWDEVVVSILGREEFVERSLPGIAPVVLPVKLDDLLDTVEWLHIDAALARSRGSRKVAAELLGMNRTTFVEKLRRREASGLGGGRYMRARPHEDDEQAGTLVPLHAPRSPSRR